MLIYGSEDAYSEGNYQSEEHIKMLYISFASSASIVSVFHPEK